MFLNLFTCLKEHAFMGIPCLRWNKNFLNLCQSSFTSYGSCRRWAWMDGTLKSGSCFKCNCSSVHSHIVVVFASKLHCCCYHAFSGYISIFWILTRVGFFSSLFFTSLGCIIWSNFLLNLFILYQLCLTFSFLCIYINNLTGLFVIKLSPPTLKILI